MSKASSKNLAPKIISIIFALVLWIYVIDTINPEESRPIPNVTVKLVNMEELDRHQLAIKEHDDLRVKVKLTGRRDEIYKIAPEQVQVRADLKGYGPGINNIPLEVIAPNNLDVDVSPRFITIELENIIRKEKDIKIVTRGKPKDNFLPGDLKYTPRKTEIVGPESHVNSVDYVVARLDLTDVSENFAVSLPLQAVNNKGEEITNVDLATSYINVSLSVDSLKTLPIKPDLQVTMEAGYILTNVEINPKELALRGQEEAFDDIEEVLTEAIKIDNLNGNRRVNVKLNLPEGITQHSDTPIIVNLYAEKIEEVTYKINRDRIGFNNIDDGLSLDTDRIPENMDIKIRGLKNVLDSIKEADIKLVVDLNGLDAGEYTIEPLVQLPYTVEKDIEGLELSPKSINIKLVNK